LTARVFSLAMVETRSTPAEKLLHGTHQECEVGIGEGQVGVVGLHHPREQGECAILELHGNAFECAESRSDLEHLQDHGLVGTEHLARCDAEQEAVADLAGGTGDGYSYWFIHGDRRLTGASP
jgi:hypothetical protein